MRIKGKFISGQGLGTPDYEVEIGLTLYELARQISKEEIGEVAELKAILYPDKPSQHCFNCGQDWTNHDNRKCSSKEPTEKVEIEELRWDKMNRQHNFEIIIVDKINELIRVFKESRLMDRI